MEINNPASCWLAAGLSVGEEGEEEEEGRGKKKKQPFRLTQWRMLRQGKRAQRQGGRQKEGERTQQTGEIVSISGPKWDGER